MTVHTGTHRNKFGLVTWAAPRFAWAQLAKGGRVHAIENVIFRWDFMGGTYEKPYATVTTFCAMQNGWWLPVREPDRADLCLRCVGRVVERGPIREHP